MHSFDDHDVLLSIETGKHFLDVRPQQCGSLMQNHLATRSSGGVFLFHLKQSYSIER